MKINVTQKDINKGVRENCTMCPVALAAKRALKKEGIQIEWLTVNNYILSFVSFVDRDFIFFYLPNQVGDFIKRFDAGSRVEPFSFEIDTKKLNKV